MTEVSMRVVCVENRALAPQSFLHLLSCRSLLGLPERRLFYFS